MVFALVAEGPDGEEILWKCSCPYPSVVASFVTWLTWTAGLTEAPPGYKAGNEKTTHLYKSTLFRRLVGCAQARLSKLAYLLTKT